MNKHFLKLSPNGLENLKRLAFSDPDLTYNILIGWGMYKEASLEWVLNQIRYQLERDYFNTCNIKSESFTLLGVHMYGHDIYRNDYAPFFSFINNTTNARIIQQILNDINQ